MAKGKLQFKTVQGTYIRIKDIVDYSIEDGFVCFVDPQTSEPKRIAVANCEIIDVDICIERGDN